MDVFDYVMLDVPVPDHVGIVRQHVGLHKCGMRAKNSRKRQTPSGERYQRPGVTSSF
jgi:hypothetical protein